jgi:hypothetical protein
LALGGKTTQKTCEIFWQEIRNKSHQISDCRIGRDRYLTSEI